MASCPQCGGRLDLVTTGEVTEQVIPGFFAGGDIALLPWRLVSAAFVACVACEYAARVSTPAPRTRIAR